MLAPGDGGDAGGSHCLETDNKVELHVSLIIFLQLSVPGKSPFNPLSSHGRDPF